MRVRWRHTLSIVLLTTAIPAAILAGEVQVSWDPSVGSTGYKLYQGTAPSGYSTITDVPNDTAATAGGLVDCMAWYFAVTAYNAAGESDFSPEVSSWPRAVLVSANPVVLESESQGTLIITGTNFRDGDTIAFSNPGIQLDSVNVGSCSTMTLSLTVSAGAALGPVNVVVTHPSGVAATALGLFSITSPSAQVPQPPQNLAVE